MLALYAAFSFLTLGFSLSRFRHLLHPQFLLSFMLVYMFLLDFAVRGESEEQLAVVTGENLWGYQLGILLVYLAIWGATFVHSVRAARGPFVGAGAWIVANTYQLAAFNVVATIILLLEILKRLSFSDWSLPTMIDYSFAPRGSAPWNYAQGNIGDSNFIYQIVIILLPLSGMIYAYQMVASSAASRVFWIALFGVVLTILIADGSRTPVFLIILTLVVCIWKLTKRTIAFKAAMTGALLVLLASAAAVMYEFRSIGLNLLFAQAGEVTWTLYHQDDNYYRTLNALDIASTTHERWSALEFFYTVAANPIPRAFWPGKPILLADFWGNYKTEWVTISFIGELVAMYGVIGGLVASVFAGYLVYLAMRGASKLIPEPGGIIVYFLMVLYGYMVFRSLFNITAFGYLPLVGFVILLINKYRLEFWVRKFNRSGLRMRNY